MIKIREIEAKTILSPSKLPGSNWSINPYHGCSFACMYCYAAAMGRWNHPQEKWGEYVDIKINAPEILKWELEKLREKKNTKDFGTIFFSSVTDPYQFLEAKYKISRKCLQVLADFEYNGEIGIQTKSDLVLRDLDILKRLKKVEVGLTITSLNDETSRFLEVAAPNISDRLKALENLSKEGIKTYAFVGPILPYLWQNESEFNELINRLQEIGVRKIWLEGINLNTKIRERLYNFLREKNPKLILDFEKSKGNNYRERIDKMVKKSLLGKKIKLAGGGVIWHGK